MSNDHEILSLETIATDCGYRRRLLTALTCSLLLHLAVLTSPSGSRVMNGALRQEALQVVIMAVEGTGEVRIPLPEREPQGAIATVGGLPFSPEETLASPPTVPRPLPQEATLPVMIAEPSIPEGFLFGSEKGYAVLELSIDSDGQIVQVDTLETDLLDDQVMTIESLCRGALFEPARLGGKAVPGKSIIRLEYHPAEPEPLRFEWFPNYQLNSG